MFKRPHSPEPLPLHPKRLHTNQQPYAVRGETGQLTFDTLLYDEIILVIFSYLSWSDLCNIQSINRNWARLSLDNELWKSLYISEYGRSRLRGVRGFVKRTDGREVKPLPTRASGKAEEVRDWKWMFRISSNWRTGRCSVEHKHVSSLSSQFISPPTQQSISHPRTYVLLSGDVVVSASGHSSMCPSIALSSSNGQTHSLTCSPVRLKGSAWITSLALDQSPPTQHHHHSITRMAAFLSSGEFHIFSMNHSTLSSSTQILSYSPISTTSRTSPIIHAVYHHPLLATLSTSFHLSLYDLSFSPDDGSSSIRHIQTLRSFTSYSPSSLVLSTPTPSSYKLVLAYTTPIYPAHWSVGVTELVISGAPTLAVSSSRTTKAFDVAPGWIDEQKMNTMREQWGRKVTKVADTQTDGKWVVLAPGDLTIDSPPSASSSNNHQHGTGTIASSGAFAKSSTFSSPTYLQLYRLYLPSSASPIASPKLTFVRTLHGQMGPVSALCLADGRCVSLGVNGSIWVWDLEGGTGAEVTPGAPISPILGNDGLENEGEELVETHGTVVFDERRIITANSRGVEVRRFDI
ncbi:hypothetical protein ABKN59_007562 [Abortiporus biennis]